MICNKCGKQIKDINADKCLNCGQAISRKFEGNGFYDILSTKEEREIEPKYHEEKEKTEKVNENLVLELINTHKVTNKLLKKQIVFKRMMTILSFVFIVVSVIFLISFMSYSAKIDTLNENLTKIHIYENSEQKETASDNNAIEQPITEEITYEIVLVESTEEQIQSFESGKDIKFKNTVFGQIADKKDGVLVVNAKVIKSEEKIFLSDNPHTEIVLGQECEFKVDEVTIKGYLKEKE